MDGDTGLSTVGHKWGFGGDFNTGVSLLEFTFPLFCLSGPAQANLPKVVLGKYVTDTVGQKYKIQQGLTFSCMILWAQPGSKFVCLFVLLGVVSKCDVLKGKGLNVSSFCIHCKPTSFHQYILVSMKLKCTYVVYLMDDLFLRSITMCRANAICSAIWELDSGHWRFSDGQQRCLKAPPLFLILRWWSWRYADDDVARLTKKRGISLSSLLLPFYHLT